MTEKEELEIIKILRKQSVFKNAKNDIVATQWWDKNRKPSRSNQPHAKVTSYLSQS